MQICLNIAGQSHFLIFLILVEEVVPFFGMPGALLSDRGMNLLSHPMKNICKFLGIEKLNMMEHEL